MKLIAFYQILRANASMIWKTNIYLVDMVRKQEKLDKIHQNQNLPSKTIHIANRLYNL